MTVDAVTAMIKARGHAASKSPAEFIDWAEPQADLIQWAEDKVKIYNQVVTRVGPHTKKGRESLSAWCAQARIKWAAEHPNHTTRQLAQAIWRQAHTKTNASVATSAAFTLYPDEAIWIVATKPGITDVRKNADGILIGMPHSVGLQNMRDEYKRVPVEIVKVVRNVGTAPIEQAAVVALDWPTDLAEAPDLPKGTLGVLAPEKQMPPLGKCFMDLQRIGDQKAYAVAVVL
jgi:hypothetical protein